MPGDNARLSGRVESKPIAMDEGVRFAIREGGKTVGSGVVTKILSKEGKEKGWSGEPWENELHPSASFRVPFLPFTQGCSSIGRAPVSKTGGCEFESHHPAHLNCPANFAGWYAVGFDRVCYDAIN